MQGGLLQWTGAETKTLSVKTLRCKVASRLLTPEIAIFGTEK